MNRLNSIVLTLLISLFAFIPIKLEAENGNEACNENITTKPNFNGTILFIRGGTGTGQQF